MSALLYRAAASQVIPSAAPPPPTTNETAAELGAQAGPDFEKHNGRREATAMDASRQRSPQLKLHPLCALFPRIEGEAFDALVADIMANGLNEPIVVYQNQILDGGNRQAACIAAGVNPPLVEFEGDDPVAFVLSANLHRRHLEKGQQAAIVAAAQDWTKAHPGGGETVSPLSTVADRAAASGTSERTQQKADRVAQADPGLAKQVGHGEISLAKAYQMITGTPRKKSPGAEKKAQEKAAQKEHDDALALNEEELRRIADELNRENAELLAQVKQLSQSDLGAELATERALRRSAERSQGEAMDRARGFQNELERFGKWFAELRKITGCDSNGGAVRAIRVWAGERAPGASLDESLSLTERRQDQVSAEQERELVALVNQVLADSPIEERHEAIQVGLRDISAALESFRLLAADIRRLV